MKYLSVTEMIKVWGLPERTIRYYCSTGKIPNVKREGKKWLIPENAVKPVKTTNVAEPKKTESIKEIKKAEPKKSAKKSVKVEKKVEVKKVEKKETSKAEVVKPVAEKKTAVAKKVVADKKPVEKKKVVEKPKHVEKAAVASNGFNKSLLLVLNSERIAEKNDGVYASLKTYFAFTTNRLDGNKLSLSDVSFLSGADKGIITHALKVKDFIETINEFKAFDLVLESASNKLTLKLLKELEAALNANLGKEEVKHTKDQTLQLSKFVEKYNEKQSLKIGDIAKFHVQFIKLSYFGENKDKIARLLLLKESLKQDLVPIILNDGLKKYYDRGLSEWVRQQMFLINTFQLGQEKVDSIIAKFRK